MTWTAKRVGEAEAFTADFAGGQFPRLGTGETITPGTAVWSCAAVIGVDANAQAMVSGGSTITGAKVTQMITGGVSGVTYQLTCTVQTSAGQALTLPDINEDRLYVV
jgi:hypothetical protein